MENETKLLTAVEVAALLQVSRLQVYEWAKGENPRLSAVRFGKRCVRFRLVDVEKLIKGALC